MLNEWSGLAMLVASALADGEPEGDLRRLKPALQVALFFDVAHSFAACS